MPTPQLLDHLLVALIILVLPVHGAWEYRRLARRVRAGVRDARTREYRSTMVMEWLLAAVVLGLWLASSRPPGDLGLALPGGWRLAFGAAATVVGLAVLEVQRRAVHGTTGADLEAMRDHMAPLADFLPRTAKEERVFRQLAITAGVTEELVYRGYLIWYFAAYLGVWPAALVAAVVFGGLHLYQGTVGMVKTGATGLVMAVLYVVTGSLLWPTILHAAIDLQGGALGRRVLAPEPAPVE
jgi:hypothetical protein